MKILESFAWADSTDEEASERADGVHPRSCWWKRCSELRAEGLIEWVKDDEGNFVTKPGWSKRKQRVSRVTNAGYRVISS